MAYDGKIIIDTAIDTKGIQKGVVGIDSMVKGAAIVASVGAIANGIKDVVGAVLDVGMGFETRMSGIKAVSGATAEEMAKLQAAAMKAGEDTVYSAGESAQAIEELIKAGLSQEQILKGGLTGALNLAAAGEIGLADAAEIAATALNAFKDDALSMNDAANILAGGANASATDIMGLKLGLSQCSAVAAGAGMTFRDTSTALALFAQNGLKGSDAGTSLKTMLLNMQPQTAAQIALFEKLGIVTEDGTNLFYDETGQLKSLADVSGVLRTALRDMSDQQRSATLETMFGTDALRAANILYKEGEKGVNDMWAAMSNVTAADVAKERLNNLAGAVEFMKGSLETVGIKIYESFKEPLKDAVNSVNDAIGSMSSAFDSPALKESFRTIGNTIREAARGFADFAAKALPAIVQGFAGLISVVDFLSPAILAAAAGFVAYKAVTGGVTLATKLAAAAQWLWNAAMAANPVGLLVAAVAALAVGTYALMGKLREASAETRLYADENRKLIQSIEDLTNAGKDSAEVYAQKISDMDAEKAATDALVEKIIELNRVQGRTAEQNDELAASAELLNSRVADSGLYYDELTGALSLTEEQLRGVVDAQDAARRQEAGTSRQNELYTEQAKITAKIKELEEARAETAKKFNALWGGNDKRVYYETLVEQDKALEEARASEAAYGRQIQETAGQVADAKKTEAGAVVKTTEAYKVQTSAMKQAAKEAEKAAKEQQEAMEKAAKELEESMRKTYGNIVKITTNAFSKIKSGGAISAREMIKNLEYNQKIMVDFNRNIGILMERGLDEGLIQSFRDAGPESAKQVAKLVNASDREIRKLNKALDRGAKIATNAVRDQFDDPTFTASGAKAVVAIDKKAGAAVQSAHFEKTGAEIAGDVETGVEGKTDDIADAAEQTVQKAKGAALQEVKNKDFDGVGRQMMYGVARGIRQGGPAVFNAIEHMVEQAIAAAKKSLEIASPSKRLEREVGTPSVDGLVKPFKDARAVDSTMSGFVSRMVAAAQFQAGESSRGARYSGAALALAGGFGTTAGSGSSVDSIIDKLIQAGAFGGDVILDGEKVGRIIEPAVSRHQGGRIQSTKRSGYRGKE